MLKLISLFLTLLLSFNANAFVKQRLSDTLTYNNIVDSSSSKNDNYDFTPPQPQNNDITDKTKNKLKKVNLKNKYSDKINLEPNDTVEITLNLENDHSWKIYPSSEKLKLVSSSSDKNLKIVKFKLDASENENIYFIYFDYLDAQNNVKQNKQLTINVNK